ncbi:MAG: cisplatin damage response ATP-dependent DNA ligase [Minwuia sp.]|nr:cisplatin damage response ATP-dependent DNA ligase [Minwuia sp.]
MQAFAELLDRLSTAPGRNARLDLIAAYLRSAPDPDRGYALASLAGDLKLRAARPAMIRDLVAERTDPELFRLSYDYVGDLAETVSLLWPPDRTANATPRLSEIIEGLTRAKRGQVPELVAGWLDRLDPTGRWALLKLVTGGLRVGISGRLARTALTRLGEVDLAAVEEVWHAVEPPYTELFDWLEGRAERPSLSEAMIFRPLMLAHPLEMDDRSRLDLSDYRAEWKWDGIRVQLALRGGQGRLFSRTGDDISGAFPDLMQALAGDAVLDGELLVMRADGVGSFNDMQQRLNRKTVSAKLQAEHPVGIRLYDILFDADRDCRDLSFVERREVLQDWLVHHASPRLDLSPLVPATDWESLSAARADPPHPAIEGVMLKRADSPYQAGRPRGLWFKWKREPHRVDCVMMYAQRGHGRRSSLYSDFTFGAWRDDELVPVGKAYFGFTDAELKELDRFVRGNTVDRYGPVRAVNQSLVLEIAFDGVNRSRRHKSGVAMRFPRIARIRWDKPAAEADTVEMLERLIN